MATQASAPRAVEVRDLAKSFRTGWPRRRRQDALRGVTFDVPRGAIFGLLGPNGAGKTTLLSILATLLLPDRGDARVLGLDVIRDAPRVRERINMASGNAAFLPSLSAGRSWTSPPGATASAGGPGRSGATGSSSSSS